jgi:hypothetical protein
MNKHTKASTYNSSTVPFYTYDVELNNIKRHQYKIYHLTVTVIHVLLLKSNLHLMSRLIKCGVRRVSQSVQRLATDWAVRGSNPGGSEISAPVQTGPRTHPASCTMSTGSFPGVESGRGVTLTPHPLLVPRSKNRVDYTSTLPKGLRGL